MSATPRSVFKVLRPAEWEALAREGVFAGSPADLKDGFIHLSDASQLAGTLAKHFAGESCLMLAAVELARLPADLLRWEASRGGALFPHLYAPLQLIAVAAHGLIALDAEGRHVPPQEVLAWA